MSRLCAILLSLLPGSLPVTMMDIARPEPVVVGSPRVQRQVLPLCTLLAVRVAMPAAASPAQAGRHRSGCGGFMDTGQPRKVELVFQDRRLDLVWILFPAEHKDAFLHAFTARYGRPPLQMEFGSVYLAATGFTVNPSQETER
jgi:hypothetical protein